MVDGKHGGEGGAVWPFRYKTTYVTSMLGCKAGCTVWKLKRFAFSVEQEPEKGRWSGVQSTSYTMIGGFVAFLRAQIQRLRRVIPVALWRPWSHWSPGQDWLIDATTMMQMASSGTGCFRIWNYHDILLLRNSVDHMVKLWMIHINNEYVSHNLQNKHASPFHHIEQWVCV